MIFRLRHSLADSPPCPAESDSLSCGLPFRFQLLSTPFRNDAVTFSYDVMAYADRDFHPVDKLPLWAHERKNLFFLIYCQGILVRFVFAMVFKADTKKSYGKSRNTDTST
jgi:hypothetical protein